MAIIERNSVHFAEHPENLLSNLYQLYACNMFVDMCMICKGYEVFAHKAVIAAASPLLKERLSGFGDCHARINIEQEVNGVDINVEDIKLLVEFIYKGQVSIPEASLSLFLEVGNHFQVLGLHRQASNFGTQFSFLSQPMTNYNLPQHPLPNLGIAGLQCQDSINYEDPNFQTDFNNHAFPGIFSNNSFMSPEKLSDSTIKQDKSLSVPVSNSTFSDLCTVNAQVESYQLLTDRNYHLNIEDTNPKLLCDFQHYTNDASIQDTNDFSEITENPFSSENSIQVSAEPSKDIFEDQTSLSSSGVSYPETLLTNLTHQTNSFFNVSGLEPSNSDQNCLNNFPFLPCKIPPNSTLPERQMRLKVKDSIGGVSLQDTSQGEKGAAKGVTQAEEDSGTVEVFTPCVVEEELDLEILEDSVEPLDASVEEHVCSQCQKSFRSIDVLTNHLFKEHNIGTMHKCLLCPFETLVENYLVEHGEDHLDNEDRQCCICGKRFKTRATLRNHMLCHASDKGFKCQKCSAHYSQRNNLIKHMASEHRLDLEGMPIEEPLACPSCSFVTWASHKLKSHQIRCHTKDKPFKCSHCSYSATERTSLVKHVRTHTQERPYICDSCGVSFVTVSSLKRHCRVHTKEKPFACKVCGQQYADNKRLKDHYLKHNSIKPFKCSSCDYSCRRKDNLQSHVRRSHATGIIEEISIDAQEKESSVE